MARNVLTRNEETAISFTTLTASSLGVSNPGNIANSDTKAFNLDDADRVAVVVRAYTTQASTADVTGRVTVYAGDDRLAWQNDAQSDFTLDISTTEGGVMSATGMGVVYDYALGPFESAKFAVKSTTTTVAPLTSPTLKVSYATIPSSLSSLSTVGSTGAYNQLQVAVLRLP